MRAKLTKEIVLDEGDCPNPKQPGPKGAALTLLIITVFQQSLIGAGNVALESRLNEQAITTKQNAVNQIASSLGKNAVVDSYGNITYTTAIEDGHAKLKAGGDATNSSDYEATKTNQNVYIGAPSTIKIASAGDLFQSWDTNSVLTENRTNEDSFHKSYNTAIKTLNTQINSLNAQNAKNDLAFQAAAQSAASYASDVQSLAKAMLQGGTFESWAKGQIQDKVNAAMATAIANATGMSPDMASQLVSWFEKKQADKKAKAKARTQEITSGLVTVASIAASFIAGPEMMAVGQAALQAVQGYQNGGMEGALVGAASGAATGYARQFGVNVSVSYSYSGGFGGSVGLGSSSLNAGVSFSQHGSSSFNIGGTYGNVSYNPTSGFSGSVNLTPGQNTGAMVNLGQHSGPSLTIQESDGSSGVGGSVTIDGKGNTTVAATYRNATVVSATGNVHNPSSFGNLSVNDNFNSDLNQNLAMGKADENLTAGRAELEAGRNAIAETGNEPQKEILNNENASVADQHGVLATLAKAGEFLTDPSSASTWLGRTTQDVVGSFLGSTGLGASDSNGFIDKNTGKYVQRTCFTAGTLIRTKSGLKPIEKIEIGDLVLSLDPKTGELSYKKVLRLFSNETPIVHRITYTNGNVINTTWNHPFFIRGKGFTEVRNIQPEERSVTVASIRNSYRIERGSGIQIGASLASLGSRSTNSNSATWKDEIRGTVGIAKIEEVYEKTKVYNFEVEENHTYFVGKDGVLVHNDASCGPGYVAGLKEAVAANGGELLGGKTLEERKAETALLREQAPNKKEFDAFYETGKTHVEVGKEAALWYSGERVLQLGVKGLIRGTEMFLGTEAGIKIASKVKGWFGAGEEVASVVSKEFATNANQAVFWSGVRNGQTAAGEWAAKNGGITLEQTLSNRGINLPTWDANNPAAIEAWRQASKKFAEGASGNVRVIQGDAVRTKSIWTEVEFPALKTNPKVNSIIAVHPDTGFETVLWTR